MRQHQRQLGLDAAVAPVEAVEVRDLTTRYGAMLSYVYLPPRR
ncbi:hypothetical protein [Trinickia soli]